MKRLALIFALLTGYCWATCGTLVQHKTSGSTNCGSGSTCSITVTAVGAGHVLIYSANYASTTSLHITSVSNETGTHCSNCHGSDGTNQVDMWYVLSATGGETTTVVTISGTPTNNVFSASVTEFSCTGTATLDTSNSGSLTSCTSCAGQTLTLTGSSDAIMQAITPNGTVSAVSSPYSSNADFPISGDTGTASAAGQSSGTGPTWTTTSGTAAIAALAIKDIASTHAMPVIL